MAASAKAAFIFAPISAPAYCDAYMMPPTTAPFDVEVEYLLPFASKSEPRTARLLVTVALFTERFPGKVVVTPALPIVIPVAEEAPMEIVPVASTTLLESPVMLMPLKFRAAKVIETLANKRRTAAAPMLPHTDICFMFVID